MAYAGITGKRNIHKNKPGGFKLCFDVENSRLFVDVFVKRKMTPHALTPVLLYPLCCNHCRLLRHTDRIDALTGTLSLKGLLIFDK